MLRFLDLDSEMAEAIRSHDWSGNPLGPPANWPPVLKTTVSLALSSKFPKCIIWGPELIAIPNDAFVPILGHKTGWLGAPFDQTWSEVWDEVKPIADKAFAGEATYLEDLELTIERKGRPEQAWFTFCYSPIRDEWGKVVGMLDTVIETTDKVLTQRQVELANRELTHRIKNTLAVYQAIAQQTFHGDSATPDARNRFNSRIAALGRAHDLLARSSWSATTLGDLIKTTLRAHLPTVDALSASGPAVQIGSRLVMSLTLALHELATNAVKFGALSAPGGRISIIWSGGDPGTTEPFELEWREMGGPPAREPETIGFGTRLITKVLPADFGGTVEVDYRPEGLRMRLITTMNRLDDPPPN